MVAPTSTMVPSSTSGRKASCCALLKRWISSTKSSVPRPFERRRRAASKIFLRSATPVKMALICTKARSVASASSRAMVVLPTPGGPQNTTEPRLPSASIRPSGPSGPRRCAWPTTSSSRRGRRRSASGRGASAARRRARGRSGADRRGRPWRQGIRPRGRRKGAGARSRSARAPPLRRGRPFRPRGVALILNNAFQSYGRFPATFHTRSSLPKSLLTQAEFAFAPPDARIQSAAECLTSCARHGDGNGGTWPCRVSAFAAPLVRVRGKAERSRPPPPRAGRLAHVPHPPRKA